MLIGKVLCALHAVAEPGFQRRAKKKNLEVKKGQKNFITQIICIYVYLLFKLH